MKLAELWREDDLAERLGFRIGKTGKCRTLTGWIVDGLVYIEIYNRRYFLEKDVMTFMVKFKKKPKI
jgi:hypothetical protein